MILPPLDDSIPSGEGDEFEGAAPNCGNCLTPMGVRGSRGREHWECPTCAAVALA